MHITALVFSKNAAAHIVDTLRSVQFADEIILVDMMSTDETVKLAKDLVSRVLTFPDAGYVEPVRNAAMQQAKGEWLLILDADEAISLGLQSELSSIAAQAAAGNTVADCYYLPRKNMIFGEWMQTAGWWPDLVLRFFRRGHVEWSSAIHSIPITRGTVAELSHDPDVALIHQNYQTVSQYLARLNHYTTIQATELSKGSKHEKLDEPAAQLVSAFRTELLSRLFTRDGLKGGSRGVGLSFMQALSDAAVVLKATELSGWQEPKRQKQAVIKELDLLRHDLAYWVATEKIAHSGGVTRLIWRLRRRLGL